MDTHESTLKQDKQITIDVPEDRLAEFYAFYSRFLAVGSGHRGRGRDRHDSHHRGGRHAGGHRCGGHEGSFGGHDASAAGTPAEPPVDSGPAV